MRVRRVSRRISAPSSEPRQRLALLSQLHGRERLFSTFVSRAMAARQDVAPPKGEIASYLVLIPKGADSMEI